MKGFGRILRLLGISVSLLGLCISPLLATAKTLPKGVWKSDLTYSMFNLETGGVNPNGDLKTWEDRTLTDVKAKDFFLYNTRLDNALPDVLTDADLNTNLVNSWKKQQIKLDLAYGVTNKLTVFVNLSHERAEADYTDEYKALTEKIDGLVDAGGTNTFNSAPDKGTSNHLNDTYIGVKYGIKDNLAIAIKASAGPLETGIDGTEKKVADGVLELETGRGYNQYQYVLFYDHDTNILPLYFKLGYIYNGKGQQNFLDSKGSTTNGTFEVDWGDVLLFGLDTAYNVNEKLKLSAGLLYLRAFKDKAKGGVPKDYQDTRAALGETDTIDLSEMTELPGSDASAIIVLTGAEYSIKEFWKVYGRLVVPMSNDAKGQVYDYPGRLAPGIKFQFGTTLYFK